MASIAGTHEIILVANSDGSMAADVRPLVRLNVSVIVENKGRLEQGSAGGGGRLAMIFLLKIIMHIPLCTKRCVWRY